MAARNRCWTSDRLARQGLPHQSACPFCDQGDATINHILHTCMLARSVWFAVLSALGKLEWA
uniref:Reverse transcriptase zinc-binding domain-containing protein n=1 Tax=Triticum urartu TaxID=4572 RepID=A0A8R7P108_TRIUA